MESTDFIYSQVPLIVVPLNISCFELFCIENVSFSESGRLEFCNKRQILVRCGEFLLDFKYGSFSHHFLHDSSEFSHVLRLEKQKIQSSSFELHQEPTFNFKNRMNPLEFDSADNMLLSHDVVYILSISLTLLMLGLLAGLYFYCKRPKKNNSVSNGNMDAELSTLIQNAKDTAVQIDTLINSARNSRIVEGCSEGLVNGQASTGGAGSSRNSCSHLGAATDSCNKGETVAGSELGHSSGEVQGGRKKKSIF